MKSCNWCDLAFDPTTEKSSNSLQSILSSECSSAGATIAPIPASVQAAYTSHNATFTGSVPGATGFGSHTSSGQTKITSSTSASPSPTRTSGSDTIVTQTLFGGGNGASETTSAPSLTSSSTGAPGPAVSTVTVQPGTKSGANDIRINALSLVILSGLAMAILV